MSFMDDHEVEYYRSHNWIIFFRIDFLSLDVEGSEMPILQVFNFLYKVGLEWNHKIVHFLIDHNFPTLNCEF